MPNILGLHALKIPMSDKILIPYCYHAMVAMQHAVEQYFVGIYYQIFESSSISMVMHMYIEGYDIQKAFKDRSQHIDVANKHHATRLS